MWADNETELDFIDFEPLIKATSKIIGTDALHPCSVGIFGNWGSGKSSLMKMLYNRYKGSEDTLTIHFNGWLFEGYEDAKTVLIGQLIEEIAKKKTLSSRALLLSSNLLKRIDYMKLAGAVAKHAMAFAVAGPVGNIVASSIEGMKDFDYTNYLKDLGKSEDKQFEKTLRNGLHSFHEDFDELLKETKLKKIIVFIDDLDRCMPDTIIGTLEAIKLFLFSKKTIFIIGADERLIKYAVRKRFPEIPDDKDRTEVGRDYLEKLIQFPVIIPPLTAAELTTYINLLFVSLHCPHLSISSLSSVINESRKNGNLREGFSIKNIDEFAEKINWKIPEDLKDSLETSYQITPLLAQGLNGNPRQAKRFLNMLLMRMEVAEQKGISLKKQILAKLMLLEYCKSEIFRKFSQWQEKQHGILKQLQNAETEMVNYTDKTKQPSISEEITAIKDDKWFSTWLKIEPKLADENVSEYFYIARDTSSMTDIFVQKMSQIAKESFLQITDKSQVKRTLGLKSVTTLSSNDANSIFETMAEKIRQVEGKPTWEDSMLQYFLEFCALRAELHVSLYLFLENIPEKNLPIPAISVVKRVLLNAPNQQGQLLLKKWSESSNKNIANAAKLK